MLQYVVRRMNTYLYFPGIIEDTCKANGWDPAPIAKLREQLLAIDAGGKTAGGVGDEGTTRESHQLRRMFEAYPDEWLHEGNAVGTADHCAQCVRDRFDAGTDSVLFHGSAPTELSSLLDVWPRYRPDGAVRALPANPGRIA